uniref:Uncharacterized protein n=1 Tax=Rhizophagus irregularis (strain DAOM 181602 / DAOM 197198 / MUCL 43194) TaxID=747089 RepID=U9STN8_RHIID
MTRGYSLEQDLKLLVNNPKYSDIINSVGMEIILEYIYTGSVKEETLTKVEDFYAAIARTSSFYYKNH